jgi:hypothetical protein
MEKPASDSWGIKLFGKLETGERQSAGAAVGSDDRLNEKLRVVFKDFQSASPQSKPPEDWHEVIVGISRHLHDESLALQRIYDRLSAIENQTKKRSSRGFSRYLLVICVGAVATLAWLSYGEAAKQVIATRGPELGWSPETKQMIANWVQRFGWTKPANGHEKIAVSVPEAQVSTIAQTVPAAVTPPTTSIDREVHQIAVDLAKLEQTVDQLAASQDKIGRNIDNLHGAVAEILVKIPEPPPPPIAAVPAVTGRPVGGVAPHSENTQNTAATSANLPVGHDVIDGALRASCGPDVQKFCGRTLRENGSVIKCLSSHRMELSPTCDAYFKEMPVHRAAQKSAPKVANPNR